MATKISWATETVNPLSGCRKVSPGCMNCYAEKMARRLKAMGQAKYVDVVDDAGHWTGKVGNDLDCMKIPGKDKMVFVNSMGDLFYEGVSDDQLDRVFASIARQRGRHTFQVLTKRPERMRDYLMIQQREVDAGRTFWWHDGRIHPQDGTKLGVFGFPKDWPLSNLWLGVTAENQEWADKRIPILLQIPAAVRFVSLEPLLAPVDLWDARYPSPDGVGLQGAVTSWPGSLDWVIIGCESGPGRRPCPTVWVRDIVDQTHAANVPVFVKQININGKVVHDAEAIAAQLGHSVEDIRKFPRRRP